MMNIWVVAIINNTAVNFYLHVLTSVYFLFFFNLFILFIFIFGCFLSPLLHAGLLQLWPARASHCGGLSCHGARALGTWATVVVARGLSSYGSQALEHRLSSCGARAQLLHGMWASSRTRDRTHVPCIGRRTPNHCATREALYFLYSWVNLGMEWLIMLW